MNWHNCERWTKNIPDEHFTVEVCRWSWDASLAESAERCGRGIHNWNVYAYIYPGHHLFAPLSKLRYRSFTFSEGGKKHHDLTSAVERVVVDHYRLPIHGGVTLAEKNYDRGKVCSVKFGGDYSHYRDERFSRYSSPQEAWEVFNDAESLIEALKKDKGEGR